MLQHPRPDDHLFDDCELCDQLRADQAALRSTPLTFGQVAVPRDGPVPVAPVIAALNRLPHALRPQFWQGSGGGYSLSAVLEGGGQVDITVMKRFDGWVDPLEPALAEHPLFRRSRRTVRRYRALWLATVQDPAAASPIELQLSFTRVLAALAEAGEAVAVACDDPPLVVPARSFRELAKDASAAAPPVRLWVRPTIAYDAATQRVDVLSWGLGHIGLPEVSIDAPATRRAEAIELLYQRASELIVAPSLDGFAMRDSPVWPGTPVLQEIL